MSYPRSGGCSRLGRAGFVGSPPEPAHALNQTVNSEYFQRKSLPPWRHGSLYHAGWSGHRVSHNTLPSLVIWSCLPAWDSIARDEPSLKETYVSNEAETDFCMHAPQQVVIIRDKQ